MARFLLVNEGMRSVSPTLVMLAIAAALFGCGESNDSRSNEAGSGTSPGGSTSGGSSGGGGAGRGGASGTAGTGGQAGANLGAEHSKLRACSVPEPCENISIGGGECPTMNVNAAICVHGELRERRVGRFGTGSVTCSAIGSSSSGTMIVVHADGRVSRASSSSGGSTVTYGAVYECALADQSYFDACLTHLNAATAPPLTPEAQDCMRLTGAFTGCVEAPARCE